MGEAMTPDPVAVSPDTSIFTALELLSERRVSGLAVIGNSHCSFSPESNVSCGLVERGVKWWEWCRRTTFWF